jgi:hypothetical protein
MSFALRGAAMGPWAAAFNLSKEQLGWVDGTEF